MRKSLIIGVSFGAGFLLATGIWFFNFSQQTNAAVIEQKSEQQIEDMYNNRFGENSELSAALHECYSEPQQCQRVKEIIAFAEANRLPFHDTYSNLERAMISGAKAIVETIEQSELNKS